MNSIKGFNRSTVLQYAVLIFLALIALGPIIVMFITSFKTQVDIMSSESMWVFQPTFDNYTHVFENKFDLFLRNSIIVSLASTALSLLVAGMAAYSLSRLEFPGRSPIAYFTLIIRMVPPAVLAIPIFILWLNWELFLFDLIDATPFLYEMENPDPYLFAEGLVDGRIGLTLFYTALNLPFAIWLLIGFLRQIPTEIEEAAIVDGCSQWQIFTRIIFPFDAARPGRGGDFHLPHLLERIPAGVSSDRPQYPHAAGWHHAILDRARCAMGPHHGDGHA